MMIRIITLLCGIFFICNELALAQSLPEKSPSKENVFIMVDKMPEFPGGNAEMLKFISNRIVYPESAASNGIEGRVLLTVIINHDGKIRDIVAKGNPDKMLEREAVRVVKLMPNWSPGIQDDLPVDVQVSIPIMFKLDH